MWSVAQTKSGQLDLALVNLARQGYGTLYPVFEKRKSEPPPQADHRLRASIVNYFFVALPTARDGYRSIDIRHQ